jgi:hypothetical protein
LSLLSPLRGFVFLSVAFPWAFAHGYLLSPHPRLNTAQHQEVRIGLVSSNILRRLKHSPTVVFEPARGRTFRPIVRDAVSSIRLCR